MPEKCLATCSDGSECQTWAMENGRCRHHGGKSTGPKSEAGKEKVSKNAITHGIYQSKETFLEHAEDHHQDAYYAIHESLCGDYELKHGRLPTHVEKRLGDIALDMVRIDMGDEYEVEHAVDESKPLTELEEQLTERGVFKKEVTSKIEGLKADLARETRLNLKDLGIYNSPESQRAEGVKSLAEVLSQEN